MAIEAVSRINENRHVRKAAVFTDSLSVVTSLRNNNSASRPNLYNETLQKINSLPTEITIIRIPSHVGIIGNEKVDQLANSATKSKQIDCPINWELTETYIQIDNVMLDEWQNEWNNETTGNHYRQLVPDIRNKRNLRFGNTRYDTLATRLRLGKCRLKAYMNQNTDTTCTTCEVPETISSTAQPAT